MKTLTLMLFTLASLAAPAGAQQRTAGADIVTTLTRGGGASGTAARYVGTGGGLLGSVTGGIDDSLDAFGFYSGSIGGLTLNRRTELLSGNVYRFYDTFSNATSARISTTVNFFGNLGSDGDELVQTSRPGLIVTCQGDFDTLSFCDEDAVLALVSGNNGLAQVSLTPDRYSARFALDLGAGQSVSLLNYAFLAMDNGGPTAADVALAGATGESLLTTPRLDGLSNAEVARIVNFTIPTSAVPEPASWALMLTGFGLVGGALRRRRRKLSIA